MIRGVSGDINNFILLISKYISSFTKLIFILAVAYKTRAKSGLRIPPSFIIYWFLFVALLFLHLITISYAPIKIVISIRI